MSGKRRSKETQESVILSKVSLNQPSVVLPGEVVSNVSYLWLLMVTYGGFPVQDP